MMEIYYLNSRGIRLNLLEPPYMIQTADIFDYRWTYLNGTYARKGNRIKGFSKEIEERSLLLSILNRGKADYYEAVNRFMETTEIDILSHAPGELHVGNMYLKCYIIASEKTEWENGIELLDNQITIVTDYPFWCRDKTYHFYASTSQIIDAAGKDAIDTVLDSVSQDPEYPRDYPYGYVTRYKPATRRVLRDYAYDYYKNHTIGRLDNDHFAETAFRIIVYGPCTHPEIRIGDNLYRVSTVLYDSEYLVIDSRERTIMKYGRNGVQTNLFNARDKENYIFQKIPAGKQTVKWNAQYAFDVVLYQERSEPAWSMS